MTHKEKQLCKELKAVRAECAELNKLNQDLIEANLQLNKMFFEQQEKFMSIFGDYLGIVEKEQEPPLGRAMTLERNY